MEINNFDDISFNYYLNTTSYVKTILDILPEKKVSKEKKALIMEIYNYILSNLSENELSNIVIVSEKFNEKLTYCSNQEIMLQVEYLYKNFLEKMLFDSCNRKIYFDIMNECVKVYTGYYQEYSNNNNYYEFNDNAISNIRIR